jgi:hypothetical protein
VQESVDGSAMHIGSQTAVLDAMLHATAYEAVLSRTDAYVGCSLSAAEQACAAAASACCCSFGTAICLLLVQRGSLQEMRSQLCGAQLGMPGGSQQLVLMLCCCDVYHRGAVFSSTR